MSTRQAARALAVGTSAGGVEALTHLAAALPADFPAPVLVVLHVPAFSASNLPAILDRVGPLTARARARRRAARGRAASTSRRPTCTSSPSATRCGSRTARPSTTTAPRSIRSFAASRTRSARAAIALVLTGALDDGAAGAVVVAAAGGAVVVQDPKDALYPDMPSHAIAAVPSAQVAPLADIPALVDRLAREPVAGFVAA